MRRAKELACEHCGARYRDMRTGLTFSEVQQMMKTNQEGEYRQIRRHSVLGFWHELKLAQWEMVHGQCAAAAELADDDAA